LRAQENREMARPVRKLLLPLILWACVSQSPANADLIWGANGHPFNAYPGIPYERQLDLVRDLGMTSYRVDISSLDHIPRLARLIAAAKEREITILPLLTPPVSLEKDTPETLYQQARTFATKVISPFKDDIKDCEPAARWVAIVKSTPLAPPAFKVGRAHLGALQ
jgi:hypothetical protein